MSELLTVDGVDIKTLAYNVETLGATLVKPARRGANAVVAGRSGVIRTPDKLHEAPTYPWPMWVRGCDENGEIPVDSDARQMFFENLDKLTALFDKDGVLDVRHTQPGSIAADVTNLVTNPSGRNSTSTVAVRVNKVIQPFSESLPSVSNAWSGTRVTKTDNVGYVRCTITDTTPVLIAQRIELITTANRIPVVTGDTLQLSAESRSLYPITMNVIFFDAAGNSLGNSLSGAFGGDQANFNKAPDFTVLAPANAASMSVAIGIYGTDPRVIGDWFDVRKVYVGFLGGDYFDGSMPAAGDFTYAWSGAPNASTSQEVAPAADGWSPGADCVVYYSKTKDMIAARAKKSGVLQYDSSAIEVLPGDTVTVVTEYEMPRSQMSRGYVTGAGFGAVPDWAFNAPSGVWRTTQIVPANYVPPTVALVPFVVNPASVLAGDTIYVRSLVVKGNYSGDYFDGSSGPGFTWDGEPDASTSTAHADVRQADCECLTAINFATSGVNPLGKFTVELQNINAYWADVFYTTQDVLPDFSDALASFGGVTAPLDDGVYTITGPATNPRITDTVKNAYIQFNGVIGAGQTLTFDAGTWEITTTGGLVATLSSMLIVGMTGRLVRLVPSDTDRQYFVEFTATDTTAATKLTITGRRKYLVG